VCTLASAPRKPAQSGRLPQAAVLGQQAWEPVQEPAGEEPVQEPAGEEPVQEPPEQVQEPPEQVQEPPEQVPGQAGAQQRQEQEQARLVEHARAAHTAA
jgi:hypothetical protein